MSNYQSNEPFFGSSFCKSLLFLLFHLKRQIDNNWETGAGQGLQVGHQWIKGCEVFLLLINYEWTQALFSAVIAGQGKNFYVGFFVLVFLIRKGLSS